jgi:hypothetical protein
LAGAEGVEGFSDFRIPGSETGGGKESCIDLTGFSGGKEGTGGRGAELPEESERFGWSGGIGNEKRRD